MEIQQEILSDITVHMKYAKWREADQRKETWEEICQRNRQMHLDSVTKRGLSDEVVETLKNKIHETYDNYVIPKKILPSMRSMQFAGKPIELSPNRVYNCAYMPVDSVECFHEAMTSCR